ncbi:aminodeoxychorismate synthase component I [Corynebacterium aurimucosum]
MNSSAVALFPGDPTGRFFGSRVLVVDNFDSFTFNIVDYLVRLGAEVKVTRNTEPVSLTGYHAVVLSPGPGTPECAADIGFCAEVLERATVPVLGVCLGFQAMAQHLGARIVPAPEPVHGLLSSIHCVEDPLYAGIPACHDVVRYHSLMVAELPSGMKALAHTADGLIMAGCSEERRWWGVQYHPESICSDHGLRLFENFLAIACPEANEAATGDSTAGATPAAPLPSLHVEERRLSIDPLDVFEALGGEGALLKFEGTSIIAPLGESVGMEALAEPPRFSRPAECFGVPGVFGYLGYEALGGLPTHHPHGLFRASGVVAIQGQRVQLIAEESATSWLAQTWRLLEALASNPVQQRRFDTSAIGPLKCRDTAASYKEKIRRAQELISAGETYEVCLTTSLEAAAEIDPLALYQRLRHQVPAPMRSLLVLPELAVASASPERFLRVSGGVVSSEPIKGTRPRGHTPAADEQLRADLASNPKDRAENLMIVDLVRNDLTRVGIPGTVRAEELFAVRSFATVHQLVSTISARLRPHTPFIDVLRSTFPGGSMTGAPKVRTMEIIRELEDAPRGVYSGAIGYLGCDGSADFAMTIRSIVLHSGKLHYGVGGAVLALSDPDAEWQEIVDKSAPLLTLCGQAFPGEHCYRFEEGELLPIPTLPEPVLIDSFRLEEGQVRGFDLHCERFTAGAQALGLDSPRSFLEAIQEHLPTRGQWFPRLEAGPSGFGLRMRPLPTQRRTTRLHSATATVDYPHVKGPNLRLFSELREPDDTLLLSDGGVICETTTAALIAWEGDTMLTMDAPRLRSVTESLLVAAVGQEGSVEKRQLSLSDLAGLELWTLNALHGNTPVVELDGKPRPAPDAVRLEHWRSVLNGALRGIPKLL